MSGALIGDAVTDLALLVDLLNTLDLRTYGAAAGVLQRDQLSTPQALHRWLVERGELGAEAVVGEADWKQVLRVREGVRSVISKPAASGGASSFEEPSISLAVRIDATAGPALECHGVGTSRALGRILGLAAAAGIDGTWGRMKICAAPDCGRVFYDSSKNRSGRWCSPKVCGNRMKTRSYRRRRAHDPGGIAGTSTIEPRPARPVRANVFRREGEYWRIVYNRRTFQLHDSKGLRYLARMLAEPGREWHVLDLVALDGGVDVVPGSLSKVGAWQRGGDAGPLLDAAAKQAYRLRIEDLDDAIEEARSWGDAERSARAQEELDAIARELARAVGVGNRDRRAASDTERARVNVARVIKAALLRIDAQSPELKHHLTSTVRTGTFCSYDPDPRLPVSWRF